MDDYTKVWIKARNKLLQEFCYEDIINDVNAKWDGIVPKSKLDEFNNWMKFKRKGFSCRWRYGFITINYREGVPYIEIKRKTEKVLKKKWIKEAEYRYECRGLDDSNYWTGVHVHIWVKIDENKNTYRCPGEVYNTVKNFVGLRKHVVMKYSNNENHFREYVKGFKKKEPKPMYQEDERLNDYMKIIN